MNTKTLIGDSNYTINDALNHLEVHIQNAIKITNENQVTDLLEALIALGLIQKWITIFLDAKLR